MSGFKDMLVVVDDSERCGARIEVAVHVANRCGAHLTGLYVNRPALVPALIEAGMVGGMGTPVMLPTQAVNELCNAASQAQQAAAGRAQHRFRAHAEVAGITTEWREREGDLMEVTVLQARYADLTIVGQADPEAAGGPARGLPEHLLLGVGHPILVVPYVGPVRTVGERVLVAWNASRAATRAVNDALPILEQATQVTVLTINPPGGARGDGDVPGADLALHLARHGVRAEAVSVRAEDVQAAAMLLSQASDLQADLVVMGGYGHSRLREVVLGGSTREILQSMTVPVLMSH
jgi:nucleotide-binding universal stress UspA family protein